MTSSSCRTTQLRTTISLAILYCPCSRQNCLKMPKKKSKNTKKEIDDDIHKKNVIDDETINQFTENLDLKDDQAEKGLFCFLPGGRFVFRLYMFFEILIMLIFKR